MPGGRDFNNSQQPPAMGEQNLQPPQGQQPPTESEQNWQPPENQLRDVNRGGFDISDTSYISSTVLFNGETWDYVGFRYSGNSTLQTS